MTNYFDKFDEAAFKIFEKETSQSIFDLIDPFTEYSGGLASGIKEGKGHHFDKNNGDFYSGAY